MSIETTAENLWEEVLHAEKVRDGHLRSAKELANTMQGSAYRGQTGLTDPASRVDNHPFEYQSLMIPRMIYDNPRFSVKTRRMGESQVIAEAMGHALNRWVVDSDLRMVLKLLAYDCLFTWSACMVSPRPINGAWTYDASPPEDPHRPMVTRIPQGWFGFDPLALDYSLARFAFHRYPVDLDDLKEMAKGAGDAEGWNKGELDKLSPDGEDANPDKFLSEGVPDRKTIMVYEIWVPGEQLDGEDGPDDGYHGTIHTLAGHAGGGHEIRKPRPFYGPPWGPYVLGGIYTVPDSPFPLSPLIATKDQQDELSRRSFAANKSAENYKRLALVEGKNTKMVKAIKDANHNVVVPVENLAESDVVQVEVGGLTSQMIEQINQSRERLSLSSGMDDAIRGNVTGRGTATEHSIAESASTVRLSFIKQQFADMVRKVGKTASWYMYHDDRVMFPFGKEELDQMIKEGVTTRDRETGEERPLDEESEPWFMGGMGNEETDYDDLELVLDVYSMDRTNEPLLQKNIMQAIELVTNIAQVAPQMPWVRWDELMAPAADAFNMPVLRDVIDMEKLAEVSGQPVSEPTERQGGRMSRDVSKQERPLEGRQTGAEQGAAQRGG